MMNCVAVCIPYNTSGHTDCGKIKAKKLKAAPVPPAADGSSFFFLESLTVISPAAEDTIRGLYEFRSDLIVAEFSSPP